MSMQQPSGRVAYEPSSLAADSARETASGFRSAAASESGERGRVRAEAFADHYSQASLFYRSQSVVEQAHIATALVFELSKVATPHVRVAVVGHLAHIDTDLAQRVANGLGMDSMPVAPVAAAPVRREAPLSPALRLIGKTRNTLEGRCIGILINEGSDRKTTLAIRKAALSEGASVKIVAPKIGEAKLSDGSLLAVDGQLAGTPSVFFDAIAVVLSPSGAVALSKEGAAIDFVRDAFGHLKAIAIDDGGKTLLGQANVEPDAGVVATADIEGFLTAAATRQWDRERWVRALV
jgi:catalase